MHTRIEVLVEDYDEVREALVRTRAEQARTRRQVLDARRHLRAAKHPLAKRLWAIYTGGAPATLGQLLAADSVHQALVTTKGQEQVVGADRTAVDRVDRLRREVEALAEQAEPQERLKSRLATTRRQIESRLAAERTARARAAGRSPSPRQLGRPYVWGASGPSSYDCSG